MNRYLFILFIALLTLSKVSGQSLQLKWATDTLLRVPESVYYDDKSGILYVSNINGKSNEKDGNGFISKVGTDGKIISLQWVTGLNAPKGMGLYKDNLYVADLTQVVVIDVKSATVTNRYDIEGGQFLNDITVSPNGEVYISDSATGKIHLLSNGKVELYFEGKDFKRVNGLLVIPDGLYVADAGTGVNYKLSKDKQLTKYTETAQGADGIVSVGNRSFVVSSWGGEVYFVDERAQATKLLDTKEKKLNSADIAYNEKENVIYVPTFYGNSVMAYTLEGMRTTKTTGTKKQAGAKKESKQKSKKQ